MYYCDKLIMTKNRPYTLNHEKTFGSYNSTYVH